jgi:hypothetical protein
VDHRTVFDTSRGRAKTILRTIKPGRDGKKPIPVSKAWLKWQWTSLEGMVELKAYHHEMSTKARELQSSDGEKLAQAFIEGPASLS